ncbi:MAG: outer membrane protein [Pseudomonadota bacterium]
MKRSMAVVIVCMLAAPSFAAGPQPVYGWSGWYAGANFGYGFGPGNIYLEGLTADTRTQFVSPQLGTRPAGFLGGAQAGMNWQSGLWVYGLETDLSRAQIGANVAGPFVLPPFNFVTRGSQNLDWFGTLRARLGVAAFDRSLFFATGGLAYGRASVSNYADLPGRVCITPQHNTFCVTGLSSQWKLGWTIGGGWEYALASRWSMKVEYLYYDLGRVTNATNEVDPLFAPPDFFRGSADVKGNIVRAGLNYKLGSIITSP